MTLTLDTPTLENLAELLDRLGSIPPYRVMLHPTIGTATEEDVLEGLEKPRKRLCELIDGVLVEKAMGYSESVLASVLIELLNGFVRSLNLGLVTSPDGTVRLWPGRVRIPDVAFFSWDRLPGRRRPEEPIPDIVPDLVAEIWSTSNTPGEMQLKRDDYFAAGVRIIWEIYPEARSLHVYQRDANDATVLSADDMLDGSPVLPGFRVPLQELFAELDRQG